MQYVPITYAFADYCYKRFGETLLPIVLVCFIVGAMMNPQDILWITITLLLMTIFVQFKVQKTAE